MILALETECGGGLEVRRRASLAAEPDASANLCRGGVSGDANGVHLQVRADLVDVAEGLQEEEPDLFLRSAFSLILVGQDGESLPQILGACGGAGPLQQLPDLLFVCAAGASGEPAGGKSRC